MGRQRHLRLLTEKDLLDWLNANYPPIHDYDYGKYSGVTYCVYKSGVSFTKDIGWHYITIMSDGRVDEHVRYSYPSTKLNVLFAVKKRIDLISGNNLEKLSDWK